MTMEFLDGILAALMPSMIVVAWFVWRASPAHADFLDHNLNKFGDSEY